MISYSYEHKLTEEAIWSWTWRSGTSVIDSTTDIYACVFGTDRVYSKTYDM